MIPILYEKDERLFRSEGIGRLVDCISCTVEEERNGTYECEFEYPVDGPMYKEILEHRIIFANHDETREGQPFDIYRRSEPIDGVVTYNAHHISYRLSEEVSMPFTASTSGMAMRQLSRSIVGGSAFTFSEDMDSSGSFSLTQPKSVRDILGGEEGSFLDSFGGGDFEFDKFKVTLHKNRGTDTGVEIRYGKNLVDFEHTVDVSETYDAIVPYWYQEDGGLVVLPERIIRHDGGTRAAPYDMTEYFEEAPSESELRTAASNKFNSEKPWLPSEGYEINFAALWQTAEYAEFAPLQRVKLCDTVLVYYPAYGIDAVREKVVKVVYNVLLDRYDEIVLNKLPATFSGIIREG